MQYLTDRSRYWMSYLLDTWEKIGFFLFFLLFFSGGVTYHVFFCYNVLHSQILSLIPFIQLVVNIKEWVYFNLIIFAHLLYHVVCVTTLCLMLLYYLKHDCHASSQVSIIKKEVEGTFCKTSELSFLLTTLFAKNFSVTLNIKVHITSMHHIYHMMDSCDIVCQKKKDKAVWKIL